MGTVRDTDLSRYMRAVGKDVTGCVADAAGSVADSTHCCPPDCPVSDGE